MSRTTRFVLATLLSLGIAFGSAGTAEAHTAQVTRKDLVEAGARCVGTTCFLGHYMWDCSGGGLCSFSKV